MRKVKHYSSGHHDTPADDLARKNYVTYQDFRGAGKLGTPGEGSFVIALFEKGKGVHIINATEHAVKPRQVHILLPEQKQKWKLQAGACGQRLVIQSALAETFSPKLQFTFSPYNHHAVLDLDAAAYHKISAEFLAVKKELSSRTVFFELVNARCRLIALMINLWMEHEFGDESQSSPGTVAYKFHSLVEKHYKTQKTVAFYAKHLCITANYLGVVCKKQYRMSALEFIQERVLLEAKRLLHSSDRSIKEVAFDLGFRNLSYFSYFFKAKTNLTPKEYKELLDNS